MQDAFEPTQGTGWVLEAEGVHPQWEGDIEARFSVSNGFLGVRGAREVSRGATLVTLAQTLKPASWPRTYVAGLFDIPDIDPPVPALMPAPDWLRVRIRLNDFPLVLNAEQLISYHRTLDMRRGVLITDWRQRVSGEHIARVRTLHLVSFAQHAIGLQLVQFELDQDGVDISLDASFDLVGAGLEVARLLPDLGLWRTGQSAKSLAMACAATLRSGGADLPPERPSPLQWSWRWQSRSGDIAQLARMVSVRRGDEDLKTPVDLAGVELDQARKIGWRGVLSAHEAAWSGRWHCSDLRIDGDDAAQTALRFAIYHLNSAANPEDEQVSIGARALTGDTYHGHVFWDTEIYLLPFYTLTWPEAARAMLMYRYRTLDGARAKARRAGFRGAMYAWESADSGEETTPEHITIPDGRTVEVLSGKQEQHISADIAYAVWQYWLATGDDEFLREAGAEILLETASFWVSRANLGDDRLYHIQGVIGPDEYHEYVNDNAFTNHMARWNIRRALEVVSLLRQRWPELWRALAGRLRLDDRILQQWRDVADALAMGYDPHTNLIEQFSGFHALEPIDLSQFSGRREPMDMVLGRERTRRSQVIKQADTVAMLALLPDEFDMTTQTANYHHYAPRCAHESSLSNSMHTLLAARIGATDLAMKHFQDTVATEFGSRAGASAGGVRIAALGGLWQAVLFGFAGLSIRSPIPRFDPRLPAGWRSLGFRLQWRGRQLKLRIDAAKPSFSLTLEAGESLTVSVRGEMHELHPGYPLNM